MGNDLVSIIMLSRNRAEFVAESVRSVLAQTFTNWELLFVDDNSTDDTIHQMMELKGKDKRISVLTSVYDKGTAYLRNSALEEARGRWMAFLDVGDVWAPDKLGAADPFYGGAWLCVQLYEVWADGSAITRSWCGDWG